jgi:hypothetical protein
MTTASYTAARKALVDYFTREHGLTLMPLEIEEIERLALELAKATEDARLVLHGHMTDRHRLDRSDSARISVYAITDDGGKWKGFRAHTERTGWTEEKPTHRAAIDAALEALKGGA